jgi:LacI family transcriptional regulator
MDVGGRKTTVTISDVARSAGVSIKSVSRVINHEPHVSKRLREKVESAIASLNYMPDMAARSLAGSRSFIIGVLFDNPSPNYTMDILLGVYEACAARKYHLRIDNVDTAVPPDQLNRQLQDLVSHSRVDGMVLTPPLADQAQVLDFLESKNIRYSRVSPAAFAGRSPAVLMDDGAAAAELADLFWAHGHRKIGLLNGPNYHGASHLRREGFITRLRQHDPSIEVVEGYGGFSFEQGIVGGKAMLSGPDRPTAIFASNDDSAAGVIVACGQLGLSVPEQVSICGFDDSWIARSVWPYLTTIRQPIKEMARTAAMLLLERNPAGAAFETRMLDFELVQRDSVGPVGPAAVRG